MKQKPADIVARPSKRLISAVRLPFLIGLLLAASGFPGTVSAGNTPAAAGFAADAMIWTWLVMAVFVGFPLVLAIIFLLARLRKTSRSLREERHRHFLSIEKAARMEQKTKEINNNINDFLFFHDPEGTIKEINKPAGDESGCTQKQLEDSNIRDLLPERFRHEFDRYLERIRKNGTDRGFITVQVRGDEEMILEYNNRLVKSDRGIPVGVRGIARDATEQVNTWNATRKSEEKYRSILDSIEEACYEVDLAGNLRFFNSALPHILGYPAEELAGKNYREFVDEKDRNTVFNTFNYVYRSGTPVNAFDWRLIRKDGTFCPVETSVSLSLDKNDQPTGFLGIIRDLTARFEADKRRGELEAQLHQSQKLESIGTLAGGIAHDFNNILFPIIGYTEMTIEELPKDSPLRENLEKVMKSAERAKNMVQQILSFSRQNSDPYTEPARIEPVIKETVRLLKNTFPATIAIEKEIPDIQGKIAIDTSRLHQVILNLCTNAMHAMENQPSGKLGVFLEQIRVTEKEAPGYRGLPPGEYARIRISDTGTGIEAKDLEKIFEPYYTTKPQEKGTGLGLSVSYGIVKTAGGIITAASTPGEGSRFDVLLPVVDELEAISNQIACSSVSPLPTGTGNILLVDDEHRIIEIEKHMIESLGYTVFSRTSSIEALEAFRHDPNRYDLVVTDQTMPNMTGMELAGEILRIHPGMPVIICTGFSEKVTEERLKAAGIRGVLAKPIPKTEMALTLRRVLDETDSKKTGAGNPSHRFSPESHRNQPKRRI